MKRFRESTTITPNKHSKLRQVLRMLLGSTIGRRFWVAASSAVLLFFVAGHLAGNLQIFLGPEAINRYARFLKGNPELLWPVRLALLACAALHIGMSLALTLENRRARDVQYEVKGLVGASLASRTMIWSGWLIGCFVGYHLAHFTWLWTHPEYRQLDVYRMMVAGFRQPALSGFYLLGVGLLCFHLSHGVAAMLQSLGWKNDAYEQTLRRVTTATAWILFAGYASIPVAVWTGVVK